MNKQYNIAMVAACPFPYPRGTPTRIYRMAEALHQRGHRVHVITYHLGELEKAAPFRIHRIPPIKTYTKLTPGPTYQKLLLLDSLLLAKLYRILGRYEFDLIHAHHYESLLVAKLVAKLVGKQMGYKVVYDAHTALESELPYYAELGLTNRLKQWIGGCIDETLPQKADHIIAVTEDLKARLLAHFPLRPQKVTVVPTGVEFEHFAGATRAKMSTTRRRLIFTGNLAAYQGVDLMLTAVSLVVQQRPDICLRIVSNDSLAPYQSLIDELQLGPYIEQVGGSFATLPQQLAAADIALNPRTDCDGLPQKLLNYMAAGKAIVSFAGSAKGVVPAAGTNGRLCYLVPDNDCVAFAQAILYLLDNPATAQKIGREAQQFARQTYDWALLVQQIEQIYDRLLAKTSVEALAGTHRM